ncbi:hypothetical protein B0H14DRAFT_3432371 [Mycena olivaceomarginata]|nr:hypothetical protein B0H14DRAFT_3432371 [Mycena olivaceomarginata]
MSVFAGYKVVDCGTFPSKSARCNMGLAAIARTPRFSRASLLPMDHHPETLLVTRPTHIRTPRIRSVLLSTRRRRDLHLRVRPRLLVGVGTACIVSHPALRSASPSRLSPSAVASYCDHGAIGRGKRARPWKRTTGPARRCPTLPHSFLVATGGKRRRSPPSSSSDAISIWITDILVRSPVAETTPAPSTPPPPCPRVFECLSLPTRFTVASASSALHVYVSSPSRLEARARMCECV